MNKLEIKDKLKDNELPERWEKIRLGKIIIENIKSRFKVEDADNFGRYPFFTSGEAILSDSNYLVDYENVFLATGGVANIKYYKGKANYSADTYCIKVKITTKYLYYFLLKNLMKIDYKYFSGSGLKHLQKNDFKKEILILPSSYYEQQKIAEILETVDDTIEKTDAIIEKYKRIKQGLMQDLLTRGIDENGQIRSEKTHKFKDSPLGRIPEEWEVVELRENISVLLSNVDKKIFNFEQKVLLCNYLDVYKNEYINNSISFMRGSANRREIKKFGVSKENVIITKDSEEFNDIAKSVYVRDEINNLICGYHLALLKPSKRVDGLYLSKILKLYNVNSSFQRRANGITRFGISKETIEKALIFLPTLPEQQRIASILSQIDETIEKEQKYKEKLERIKQGLMEDLLTGKMRVLNVN